MQLEMVEKLHLVLAVVVLQRDVCIVRVILMIGVETFIPVSVAF